MSLKMWVIFMYLFLIFKTFIRNKTYLERMIVNFFLLIIGPHAILLFYKDFFFNKAKKHRIAHKLVDYSESKTNMNNNIKLC